MLLAASRPAEALAAARAVLAGRPSLAEAAIAHQTVGFIQRDFGDAAAAVGELQVAARLARRSGIPGLYPDVLASLAVGLVWVGRTKAGLAAFERALAQSRGVMAARVLHRRGIALQALGRYPEALADLRRAVSGLRRADDPIWTARALTARGLVHLAQGAATRADADFVAAGNLFAATSQDLESVYTVHNRAKVAYRSGDLPTALAFLDQAAHRYQKLNVLMPELCTDRCAVLLAAGLHEEALAEADAGIAGLERIGGQATQRAELQLAAATSALAARQPLVAVKRAQAAQRLFRSQQREWWQAHALLVLLQAKYAAGATSVHQLRAAEQAATDLDRLGSAEVTQARLLAGRLAQELGRRQAAERHLTAAARDRQRGSLLQRAVSWLAEALRRDAAADSPGVLSACRYGLDVLDAHQVTLGALELRAQATVHGAELARLAMRHAMRAGRPRLLLTWSERWRATAMAVPVARLPTTGAQAAELAALREVASRLSQARAQGNPTGPLEREQHRLEHAVLAKARQAPGFRGSGRSSVSVPDLLDLLGPAQLLEIIEVDGALYVLACRAGKVQQIAAGRLHDAAQAAQFARFALRRLARHRLGDDPRSALSVLAAAGARLEEALLGNAVNRFGDGPVVIVPPGRLHAIPWAALPSLHDREISIAPSARTWMRARAALPPPRQDVVLIRGPGLPSRGAEIENLVGIHSDVSILADGRACARNVLEALNGVWLAHIAAHGTFRADSPMFSSLLMDDGPLMVYDIEQLHRAPYRLILASCESAALALAGADELLGLVASLLPLGTAGIIASVVPLDDATAVPVMVSLHEQVRAGHTLAEALRQVRCNPTDDPVERATTLSLLALGAG